MNGCSWPLIAAVLTCSKQCAPYVVFPSLVERRISRRNLSLVSRASYCDLDQKFEEIVIAGHMLRWRNRSY
jgi:hypothetical protein